MNKYKCNIFYPKGNLGVKLSYVLMRVILGIIIGSCRIYCCYTQEYMAYRLGVTTHTYANMERGRVDITVNKLSMVAKLFGLQAHQLLSLAEEISENGDDNCIPRVIRGMIRSIHINSKHSKQPTSID